MMNRPTPEKLKEVFLASQAHAEAHLNDVRKWENLIKAPDLPDDKNKRVKTRSTLTVKHIRKLMEWRYPVLEQAFLAKQNLFNPVGREARDAPVAKAHKAILNYQFNNEMDKVSLVSRMVRAYMNQATVVTRLGWRSEKEKITKIVPVFKHEYIAKSNPKYETLEKTYVETAQTLKNTPQAVSSLPPHIVEGTDYYTKHKQIVDVTITDFVERESEEEEYTYNQPVLDVVNLYDVFASPECKTNIQDSPYVIFRFNEAIHVLEANDDYDTSEVNWDGVVSSYSGSDSALNAIYSGDDKRRTVEVFEYWGLHDTNGDGKLEQVKVTWVEGQIIEAIPNPFPDKKHPFYSAAYSPDTELESFYGSGEAYLAEDNQAILSAMHRGIIDIHANSAYGQRGIAKNVLDPVNRAKFLNGDNFEYDSQVVDPSALFKTFDFPSVNPSTMAYMQQINAESDALTGIKSFNEGISGSALGDTAAGVSGVLSATALRESSIIGRLEGMIIQVAKRIMNLNVLYLDIGKIVQLAGIEGLVIKTNHNPLIDVALDVTNQAEDALKAKEISFMLQTLGQSMPPELVKASLMEIAQLRNMNTYYNLLDNFDMAPPAPSEMEQRAQELQVQLLEAQLGEVQARTAKGQKDAVLSEAKAGTEQAKASKTTAETDKLSVETDRLTKGQETEDKIRVISAQAESMAAANLLKSSPMKGFNGQ